MCICRVEDGKPAASGARTRHSCEAARAPLSSHPETLITTQSILLGWIETCRQPMNSPVPPRWPKAGPFLWSVSSPFLLPQEKPRPNVSSTQWELEVSACSRVTRFVSGLCCHTQAASRGQESLGGRTQSLHAEDANASQHSSSLYLQVLNRWPHRALCGLHRWRWSILQGKSIWCWCLGHICPENKIQNHGARMTNSPRTVTERTSSWGYGGARTSCMVAPPRYRFVSCYL